MFSWLKKEKPKAEKPKLNGPLYIYKPYENSVAYRVERRDTVSFIYIGWAKSWSYRLENSKIFPAGSEEPACIIIENKIYDRTGEKMLYRVVGDSIYKAAERNPCYVIKTSITVQGTL